ncbi:transposase-like protein [Macrophomina phaseolina MS6]|uniref:Transposase-like protein n=1 Tax=Macrophomina phaseolina (strain MS6) TaxID=1126212 RepID=K2R659_MACPH|nr:transposase-like protein [Macrophomina phaseolina MS6]
MHLSADVWSAPNHEAFLGTCAKFLDPDIKETLKALLALSKLPGLNGPGSHGGAEQLKLLHHVSKITIFGIILGFYTGDNHGSNDKLCRLLGQHLKGKGINWDAKKQRIRCHGHVINLIVQAFTAGWRASTPGFLQEEGGNMWRQLLYSIRTE